MAATTNFDHLFESSFSWNDLPYEMHDLIIQHTLDAATQDAKARLRTGWRIQSEAFDECHCPPYWSGRDAGDGASGGIVVRLLDDCMIYTAYQCTRVDLPHATYSTSIDEDHWLCTRGKHQKLLLHQATAKLATFERAYSIIPTVEGLCRFAAGNAALVHKNLLSVFRRAVEEAERLEVVLRVLGRRSRALCHWWVAFEAFGFDPKLRLKVGFKEIAMRDQSFEISWQMREAIVFAKMPKEYLIRAGWGAKVDAIKRMCLNGIVKNFIFNQETIFETWEWI